MSQINFTEFLKGKINLRNKYNIVVKISHWTLFAVAIFLLTSLFIKMPSVANEVFLKVVLPFLTIVFVLRVVMGAFLEFGFYKLEKWRDNKGNDLGSVLWIYKDEFKQNLNKVVQITDEDVKLLEKLGLWQGIDVIASKVYYAVPFNMYVDSVLSQWNINFVFNVADPLVMRLYNLNKKDHSLSEKNMNDLLSAWGARALPELLVEKKSLKDFSEAASVLKQALAKFEDEFAMEGLTFAEVQIKSLDGFREIII